MPSGAPRQRIVEAAYVCVARKGIAKTTVEDAAREAEVSRATVYRAFPGGRQELINAVVAWATLEFFARLYEHVQGAKSLEEVMERGIMFAHRAIVEHEVLQRVMQTEPEKLLPALTFESIRIRDGIAEFLVPFLHQRGVADGVDLEEAAEFLARMVLSYMSSPGRWDLDDPGQVAQLVRAELLAGVVGAPGPGEFVDNETKSDLSFHRWQNLGLRSMWWLTRLDLSITSGRRSSSPKTAT